MKIYKPLMTKKGLKLVDPETNRVRAVDTKIVRLSVRRKALAAGQYIVVTEEGTVKRYHPSRVADLVKAEDENAKKDFFSDRGEQTPDEIFKNLEILVKMVGRNIQPSLVVSGLSGMGKTFVIKETLKSMPKTNNRSGHFEESVDYVHIKGKATTAGIYAMLYEYSDKIIVLDDCDSIHKDPDAINMLKGALDSYDKRTLSYISSKPIKGLDGESIPSQFEFTGQIIFITNYPQSKIDPALRSRSFVADISMNQEQLFSRLDSLIEVIEPRLPMKAKRQSLELMKELAGEYKGIEINMRSFIKVARIAALQIPNLKEMALAQIANK
jgi:DNA polymerase III delta prime subunit